MIRVLALLAVLSGPALAQSEQVIGAISQNRISITANFDGSEIFLFGAVKRDAPAGEDPIDVVITVTGPSTPVTVRRKARTFGIWINRDAVAFEAAPSYYSIATTGPLNAIMSGDEQLLHNIGYDRVLRLEEAPLRVPERRDFSDALVRINEVKGSYAQHDGIVDMAENTLFSTHMALPANLVEGDYQVRMFLLRGGKVISNSQTEIYVRKVGLERWIYALAHERPLIYGLLSLAVALFAGWGASEIFRLLRR